MYMRRRAPPADMIFFLTTILSLIILAVIVMFLIRIQRGILGFVLAALAVVLIVYWMKEFRKTVKEELFRVKVKPSSKTEQIFDVTDHGLELTVTAEVPGPEDEIKTRVIDRNLVILGGQGFSKSVKLSEEVDVIAATYRNGVLQVRLKKIATSKDKP